MGDAYATAAGVSLALLVRPHHFRTGHLGSVSETSLVLKTSVGSLSFLVGVSGAGKFAVALDAEGGFRSFECSDNTNYGGLIVPSPCFDLDIARVGDGYDAGDGDLVRYADKLSIVTKGERFSGSTGGLVELLSGLPSGDGPRANFPCWEISVASATDRDVLYRWPRP